MHAERAFVAHTRDLTIFRIDFKRMSKVAVVKALYGSGQQANTQRHQISQTNVDMKRSTSWHAISLYSIRDDLSFL